jgi:hypothetical protein
MIVLGLLLGLVGTDVNSGVARYSFDIPELTDGIGFIVIAMGVFGFGEIIANLSQPERSARSSPATSRPLADQGGLQADAARHAARHHAGLGAGHPAGRRRHAVGLSRPTRSRRRPSSSPAKCRFGKGNIRGVAAPESANNAGAQTSFIPLLTLGIPPNAVMALMVGAMTIHNIQPGPQVMTSNPELFWGLIASMWIGNLMLIILNLPLIGMWIKLLTVPYRFLFPAIVLFCCIGRVLDQQQHLRRVDGGLVRHHRLHLHQAGHGAGAAAAGLHPGPDDGGEPAPRAAAVARRLERPCHAPAVGRAAGHGGAAAAHHRAAALGQEEPRDRFLAPLPSAARPSSSNWPTVTASTPST